MSDTLYLQLDQNRKTQQSAALITKKTAEFERSQASQISGFSLFSIRERIEKFSSADFLLI